MIFLLPAICILLVCISFNRIPELHFIHATEEWYYGSHSLLLEWFHSYTGGTSLGAHYHKMTSFAQLESFYDHFK